MEDMGTILMNIYSLNILTINISTQMRTFIYDKASFTQPLSTVGKSRSIQSGSNNQIIIIPILGHASNTCVRQIPKLGRIKIMFGTTQKESGVSGFCLPAVEVLGNLCKWTEQSDTHAVGIYSTPLKVCMMTFYSHRHTNGNGYIPTRSIYFCNVLDLHV